MFNESNLSSELLETAGRKKTTAERFEENYPRVEKTFDRNRVIDCAHRSVRDLTSIPDAAVHVNTNSAALTRIDAEIYTTGQFGCVNVYGHNGKEKLFSHITPNDRLGYKYREFKPEQQQQFTNVTVDRIMEPVMGNGGHPGDFKMVILANLASEDNSSAYGRQTQARDLLRLQKSFERYGVKVGIVELPLANSAVYSPRENPNEIRVVGQTATIRPDTGEVDFDERPETVASYKIDLEKASGEAHLA